nr:hypothetical protein [Erwinia sp. Ejp617]
MPLDPIKLTNEGSILTQSTGRKSYASATAGETFVRNIMNVDNSPQDMGGSTSRKDNAFRHDLLVETVTHAQKPTIGEKGRNTPTRSVHRLELGSFIGGNIRGYERIKNLSISSIKYDETRDVRQKINNLFKNNDHAEVERLLENQVNVKPFLRDYERLLKAYADSGNIDHAERLFVKLTKITTVTTNNCNIMMYGYSVKGEHKKAENLLDSMEAGDLKQHEVKLDNDTYTSLIYSYLNNEGWESLGRFQAAAYALFRAGKADLSPKIGVLISLLAGCEEESDDEIAANIACRIPEEVLNSLINEIEDKQLKKFIKQAQAVSIILRSDSRYSDDFTL